MLSVISFSVFCALGVTAIIMKRDWQDKKFEDEIAAMWTETRDNQTPSK